MTLLVRIEPDATMFGLSGDKQPLAAYVVQSGVHGDNLIGGRCIRTVDAAKSAVQARLMSKMPRARIEWEVKE